MKVKAEYRIKGANPFVESAAAFNSQFSSRTTEVPDDMPWEEIQRLARKATPEGYEFLQVKKVND